MELSVVASGGLAYGPAIAPRRQIVLPELPIRLKVGYRAHVWSIQCRADTKCVVHCHLQC